MDEARPLILIVDDNPQNLTVLGDLLRPHYRVRAANSGLRALQLVALDPQPHLVLLDVMMPGMDGYEVLARMRARPQSQDIPVIFVTAMGATEDEEHGLMSGAVDYVTKPLRPAVLLARVAAHVALRSARLQLDERNAGLEREVRRRVAEIHCLRDVGIHALARLAETRDNETGNHILRTREYVRLLGRRLLARAGPALGLEAWDMDMIARSAPLHDIGKVGIPDRILLKPGRLDAAEWAVMRTHAALGAEAIAQAERDAGGELLEHLRYAKQIARSHHERWDGDGYPDGLRGEAIPLPARLMALADVFDALVSPRVYKRPWSLAEARAYIVDQSGKQFDPAVVTAFEEAFDDFCGIAHRFADAGSMSQQSC
ncbi:MAG TPA: two-component system response regulator [Roseateles sp.]|nr:two-component system response regulator [Roseateles sp.]